MINCIEKILILIQLLQGASSAQPISYDDFLQCITDAVTSELDNDLQLSKLPNEVLQLMKTDLYENIVLQKFASISKDDLTKVLLAKSKQTSKKQRTTSI